jgi:hypothetical protein
MFIVLAMLVSLATSSFAYSHPAPHQHQIVGPADSIGGLGGGG